MAKHLTRNKTPGGGSKCVAQQLAAGLAHSQNLVVTKSLTVPAVSNAFVDFVDMPPVFATAFMVGFIEATCVEALRPFLSGRQRTVGTYVDVSHVAATPADPKIPAGFGNVTNLLGMPEDAELALNIPFCLQHRKHPFCSVEPQKNVSQVRTYLHL
jgi:hypothetical protein